MNESWLKYDRRVPRYTSYPTAPHFHPGIDAGTYARWLSELPADMPLSLYFHVPFCDSLCWFCGCHTKIVRRHQPVAKYVGLLKREMELVSAAIGRRQKVRHLHWGGGTPTMMTPEEIGGVAERLRALFDIAPDAEFAVEIDPRELEPETVRALGRAGVTRASLGVQDLDPEVQVAINRIQPFEVTALAVERLREAGVTAINIDLMYGLPHQTTEGVCATVSAMARLRPQRFAVFGYAHVPWMKKHMALIDASALPDAAERLRQSMAAAAKLTELGYVQIGLDHFALPDDPLAVAQRNGTLHRNFQGYTVDDCPALIGLGASAIGSLPQGYVQNLTPIGQWSATIEHGHLAAAKGVALSEDDRQRRAVIEQLMCNFEVDLDAVGDGRRFAQELADLQPYSGDGLIDICGNRIEIRPDARPLVRTICAVFDRYLAPEAVRHAPAI